MRKLLTPILGFVALGVVAGCAPVDYNTDIYGYLEGHVTIGPICPIEREGVSCPVPPEAYAARELLIYYQGQGVSAKAQINSSGNYWIALRPGRYRVDINKVGMDRSQEVPHEIDVRAGETIQLDIDIDTGIR